MGCLFETQINYHALTVSIFTGCPAELAFEKLQAEHPDEVRRRITETELKDMRAMRARGKTIEEIADTFGVTWNQVYGKLRARRYKAGDSKCRHHAFADKL